MCLSGKKYIEALIFDLDGVILDSMPAHVAAWQSAFAEVGLEIAPEFFYRHEGALDRENIDRMVIPGGRVLSPDIFDRLLARQRELYLERYAAEVGVFPLASRLIERLAKAPVRLALVTSSTRQVLSAELWDWLDEHFSLVVTGDQVRRSKPHPEPYLRALDGLKLESDAGLAVENAPAGIESAQRAGLTCLALATTLPASELTSADLVLAEHQALALWLERHNVFQPAVPEVGG